MPIKCPLRYLINRARVKGRVTLHFYLRHHYEKRAFSWHNLGVIKIYKTGDGTWHLFIEEPGQEDFISRDYKTLRGLKRFLEKWLEKNGEIYIFVKPSKGGGGKYISLRNLLGLTIDEAEAWRIIMARALGYLNYRRVYGIKAYKYASKECAFCGRLTNLALVIGWDNGTRYSVPYCLNCLKTEVIKMIETHVNEILEALRDSLEEL